MEEESEWSVSGCPPSKNRPSAQEGGWDLAPLVDEKSTRPCCQAERSYHGKKYKIPQVGDALILRWLKAARFDKEIAGAVSPSPSCREGGEGG